MSIRTLKTRRLGICLLAAAATVAGLGCSTGATTSLRKGFLDPTAVGRFNKQPMVVPILTSLDRHLDVADEGFRGATEVRPEDLEPVTDDYTIGRNDLVTVAITDLVAPNVESIRQNRVSESGMISLPLIGQVKAAGLTEAQLEQEISQAYRQAQVIQNAQVSVSVVEARARTFSILGSVAMPGQYAILNSEFRLLDALVLARDVTAQGVDNIYVVRQLDRDRAARPAQQPGNGDTEEEDVLTPRSAVEAQRVILAQISAEISSDEQRVVTIDGRQVTVQPGTQPTTAGATGAGTAATAPAQTPAPDSAAVRVDGPAQLPAPAADVASMEGEAFAFRDPVAEGSTRVIRIPYESLRNGDLRYNVIIKPYDLIIVPQPVIGEFYMGGHVQRSGVYSLTARKITLKQAIVSAGGFDNIAVPAQTEIIRRLSDDREIFVSVDLDKVWEGSQPDIFLRPNDIVNVGTTWWAPFIASMRGGFRLTYGFGFLYDRNWGDEDRNR